MSTFSVFSTFEKQSSVTGLSGNAFFKFQIAWTLRSAALAGGHAGEQNDINAAPNFVFFSGNTRVRRRSAVYHLNLRPTRTRMIGGEKK
jgi:hypothetical protein